MVVGWYHSHPGFGCWLSGVDINTQQVCIPECVPSCTAPHTSAHIADDVQSWRGALCVVGIGARARACTCMHAEAPDDVHAPAALAAPSPIPPPCLHRAAATTIAHGHARMLLCTHNSRVQQTTHTCLHLVYNTAVAKTPPHARAPPVIDSPLPPPPAPPLQSFESLNQRAVAVVVDPVQSVKGKVVIDAFRLISPQVRTPGASQRQR